LKGAKEFLLSLRNLRKQKINRNKAKNTTQHTTIVDARKSKLSIMFAQTIQEKL
jgi:hypothetical protein